MLHLCPVGDPVLFLWLLWLKSQIKLIALSSANSHPAVLWHYTVVDGSLEEPKLAKQRKREIKNNCIYLEKKITVKISRYGREDVNNERGDYGLQGCGKTVKY